MSQHKMGMCQGFGSVSYSHHTSHLVGALTSQAAHLHLVQLLLQQLHIAFPAWEEGKLESRHLGGFCVITTMADVHLSSLSTPLSKQK